MDTHMTLSIRYEIHTFLENPLPQFPYWDATVGKTCPVVLQQVGPLGGTEGSNLCWLHLPPASRGC